MLYVTAEGTVTATVPNDEAGGTPISFARICLIGVGTPRCVVHPAQVLTLQPH